MRGYRADFGFDGERELPGGVLVLVEGGRIVAVEPGTAPAPDGCDVVHHAGTALLPGLIDCHTHLCTDATPEAFDKLPGMSEDDVDAIVTASLRAQLAAGVTTVRDLGDHHWAVVDRHRGRDGAPTVVAAGPPITSRQGHCWTLGGEAAGVEGLQRAVDERAERGADVVKIMTSGGVMTPGTDLAACQFTLAELRATVERAHAHGLPVTAHAHALPAVEQCLTAGVDGIEHCSCITARGNDAPAELVEALAAAGTDVCLTLGREPGVEPPPEVAAVMERHHLDWDSLLAHAGRMYRGGARLVSGADSGIGPPKPHGVLPHAVADLVRAGVPAGAALASATGSAARVCGLAGSTGRLRTGLDADLLIVDGRPWDDIGSLLSVRAVVLRGREVDRGRAGVVGRNP